MTDLVRKVTLGRTEVKDHMKFKTGDTVEVHVKVKEGNKERIQIFKGVIIKTQGSGMGRSFTVRKMSDGVGVERTFPYVSPSIADVKVLSHGKVRRSRIYFLRNLRGRAARLETTLVKQEKKVKKTKAEPKAEGKKDEADKEA
jgi:large subunit ribosomal protein L19